MLDPYPVTVVSLRTTPKEVRPDRLFGKLYRFRCKGSANVLYLVEVEYYRNDVFAIKFYPKPLRLSEFRYNIIFKADDLYRIIATVVEIALMQLNEYPTASFGFIGVQTLEEHGAEERLLEVRSPSQRFRAYEWFAKRMKHSDLFVHRSWPEANSYLLLNKRLPDLQTAETMIMNMFVREFDTILDPRSNDGSGLDPATAG